MTQQSRHLNQFKILVVLIIAASCFRIVVCFAHNPMDYIVSDMLRHWENGGHFPRGGYMGASDPIGYQVYIFALRKLVRDNRYLIALASSMLSVLMPWTFYRAARNFGFRKLPALWVWALIAWTPSLIVIYHFFMMEPLLLLLEGVALWMTARYLRKGGTEAFLSFVFAWTLASLTKPTVIPLAGICFLWVWWKKSTPLRQIAWGAALALIMLVPQAVRSKIELGFIAPFGNTWLTRIQLRSGARRTGLHYYTHALPAIGYYPSSSDRMWEFGSPSCFVRPLEPLSHWAMRRAWGDSWARIVIHSANGEQDWKDALARYTPGPQEWLAQWRENIVLFFFAPSWPETDTGAWDAHLEYWARWLWMPLIVLVLIGNAREFLHRRFDLIPVAVTLFTLLMAFQNVIIAEGRYRKPVEPLLWLNAVWLLRSKTQGENPLTAQNA